MKKLSQINEGWGSLVRRDLTDDVREEDIDNFFGPGIRYKFYVDGDKKLFTWKECKKIEKSNPGWRMLNKDDINNISGMYTPPMYFSLDGLENDGLVVFKSDGGKLKVDYCGYEHPHHRKSERETFIWVDRTDAEVGSPVPPPKIEDLDPSDYEDFISSGDDLDKDWEEYAQKLINKWDKIYEPYYLDCKECHYAHPNTKFRMFFKSHQNMDAKGQLILIKK